MEINTEFNFNNIEINISNRVAHLWLNRPEKHNALNPELMQEIVDFFEQIKTNPRIRIVVIRGKGASFCAGADINWMQHSASLSEVDNLAECHKLSQFFNTLYNSPQVVIGFTHGNSFGGGVGLGAVCDMHYASQSARFSLSETKLGLAAASITPFLLKRMPPSALKELVFTARHFDGAEAEANGLVDKSFQIAEDAEFYIEQIIEQILQNGPQATTTAKELINNLSSSETEAQTLHKIPDILAQIRVGNEAKEGFRAFLEKRKPTWYD